MEKKKKIIFFTYSMCFGGIEKALLELLDRLDYSKYDITLVLEKGEGELLGKLNKNVKIVNYNISDNKVVFKRKIINFTKRLKFLLLNYKKYDFACCYASYSKMCSSLCLKTSENTAIFIHGDYVMGLKDENKFINLFVKQQKINSFNKVVFVSNESKENAIKVLPSIKEKSVVLNNFINNNDVIFRAKEEINIKKETELLFTFVGRLTEEVKKVSKLINLVEYLRKNKIDVSLWIVGDGPDYDNYKKMIKEKKLDKYIKLLGNKINPYPYIRECDYLTLTSEFEGFPVTFLEALALNKKIITTNRVSDDTIDIKDYGFIVSKDEEKLKKEVYEIVKNKNDKKNVVDFDEIYKERISKIEKLIDGEL